MKLSERSKRLNYGSEGKAPVRKLIGWLEKKISFLIYYLVLLLILYLLVTTGWYRVWYINGHGIVIIDQRELRADTDLYIDSIRVNLGSNVEETDTLLFIKARTNTGGVNSFQSSLQKRRISLGKELQIKAARINEGVKNVENLDSRITRSLNQQSLELKPDENIVRLRGLLSAEKNKVDRLRSEYQIIIRAIDEVDSAILNNTDVPVFSGLTYSSPWSGEVQEIVRQSGEFVEKGEPILRISTFDSQRVMGFFKLKDYEKVIVGSAVKVKFPYGKTVQGTIKQIMKTAEHLPDEFKKSYDISRPYLFVEIEMPTEVDLLPAGMTLKLFLERR